MLAMCVENDGNFVENSLTTAKCVRMIHVNFIVTEITFSEKKFECITFVPSLVFSRSYNVISPRDKI
jgi:hypothetical protein